MHYQDTDNFLKLRLRVEKQAQQISLLEDELFVTSKALQEKAALADALELDLEHAIYTLHNHNNNGDVAYNM